MKNNLFKSFEEEVSLNMLFLKNVKEIRMTIIREDESVECIASAIRSCKSVADHLEEVTVTNLLTEKRLASFYYCSLTLTNSSAVTDSERQLLELSEKLKVLPTVTVAGYKTHDDDELSDEESSNDSEDGEYFDDHLIPDKYKDRVSVLLPLPVVPGTKTTFPVIVNAFFAVSENRRSIKFEAEDDHSDEVDNDNS